MAVAAKKRTDGPALRVVPPPKQRKSRVAAPIPGPPPPAFLDAEAMDVWRRVCPMLLAGGRLADEDADLFGAFCCAVVHHRRAVTEVNAGGVLVVGYRGDTVKNPALQVVRDQATLMREIGARFGLSPADRAALVKDDDDADAKDEGWLTAGLPS